MMLRSCLVLLAALAAAPAGAEPTSIRQAVQAEVARVAAAEHAAARLGQAPAPVRRKNWVQRHPVATATIAAFLGGFAVGWAMGDDGTFDDFTGEFNGLMLGGICAGSAATVVGIMQAVKP